MSFARIYSAQPEYLNARMISVETDVSKGLHAFQIVGLADKAVDESRERVSAALKNSNFESPKHTNKRVVVSLAPADFKKEGPRFDLPIALSYLLACGAISFDTSNTVFIGELSLRGDLRPVHGILPIARSAYEQGIHTIFVPRENAEEAALIRGLTVLPAATLTEVVDHLRAMQGHQDGTISPQPVTELSAPQDTHSTDFGDIRGQETAKRGLEIAAAGRHNIMLYGPPGTGKTLLARAFQSILPPLSLEESLEATAIHSIAGQLRGIVLTTPPFRSPHHSASYIALIGGGSIPRPGEITLAHRGILFLDEFPEFDRRSIDSLREPLEERVVSIARAKSSATFPANFILVGAMNPNRERGDDRVSDLDRERLKKRLSGPIIDRVDLWIEVGHVDHAALHARTRAPQPSESALIRARVHQARKRQEARYASSIKTNGDMTVRDLDLLAHLTSDAERVLTASAQQLNLSPRTYHRTVKLARTIADLASSGDVDETHVLEALAYRPKGLFE